MTSYTQYRDPTDTSAFPSPIIWADCPTAEIAHDFVGWDHSDDFTKGGITQTITTAIAAPEIGEGFYNAFGSAGATITYDDAGGGGVILSETTVNESVSMNTEQHPFQISANKGKLWFEARWKVNTIVTNEAGVFVGLMDAATLIVGLPLTTASALITTQNFVGFHLQEANTTAFDFTYQANSVSPVEMKSDIGTLVADTYVKTGFVFDPTPSTTGTANQIVGYVDGVRQADQSSPNHPFTVPDNTGTDFPADVRLGLCIGMMEGAGASDNTLTMDWWRCAQLR